MSHVTHIFDAFGGPTALAKALNVNPSTASEMKRRGSIPVRYWPELVRAAAEIGKADQVTYEALVEAHVHEVEVSRSEHRRAG